jgi:hypothetical protein
MEELVRKTIVDVEQFHNLTAFLLGVGCRRRALAKFMGDAVPDRQPAGACCDSCDFKAEGKPQEVGWEVSAILTAIEAGGGTFTIIDVVHVLRGKQPKRLFMTVPTNKMSCASFGCCSKAGANKRTTEYLYHLIGAYCVKSYH